MIEITDLKEGMMLEFTHPTSCMYTNGRVYEVFRVRNKDDVQLMDDSDFPHDWDIDHIADQFKIANGNK